MNKLFTLRKFLLLLCVAASIRSFAAFIGDTGKDNHNKKITLKGFNRNDYKINAYPSFRLSDFQFKGSQNIYQINSGNAIEGQSFVRLQHGNTTYVYPYKYKVKVKVPLFKTPTPPNTH
jgi:hypothetical protein